jgi:hypothetical protein
LHLPARLVDWTAMGDWVAAPYGCIRAQSSTSGMNGTNEAPIACSGAIKRISSRAPNGGQALTSRHNCNRGMAIHPALDSPTPVPNIALTRWRVGAFLR